MNLKWKNEYAPEYALFLKGARRVGKTTIAEELGRYDYIETGSLAGIKKKNRIIRNTDSI